MKETQWPRTSAGKIDRKVLANQPINTDNIDVF